MGIPLSAVQDLAAPGTAPTQVDACEREPIHIPGMIQPHGALVAFDANSWAITACSANTALFFDRGPGELLGNGVDALGVPDLASALGALRQLPPNERAQGHYSTLTPAGGVPLAAMVHEHAGQVVLEVERLPERPEGWLLAEIHNGIRPGIAAIRDAGNFEELANRTARTIRRLTGLERVLVYRFDAVGNGDVVGEDKVADWDQSFIGFRFPASDIPAQARALYAKSRIRMAPDRDAEPVPLLPAVAGAPPLDLSHAQLRSLSPVHLDYHRNMGVNASLSVSIMKGGRLWGLIVGHHRQPHPVPLAERTLVGAMADAFSLGLEATESAAERVSRTEHIKLHARLLEQIAGADDFVEALTKGPVRLTDLFYASSGVAVVNTDTITTVGDAPPVEAVARLVVWLRGVMTDHVHATDELPQAFPEFAPYREKASGLLALMLGDERQHLIIWFRPEIQETITWGGDPRKPMGDDPTLALPRKSFERWLEVRRGHSRPWPKWKIDIARSLRVALTDLTLRHLRRIADLNAKLEESSRAKSDFLTTMSHELRTPLNAIIGFSEFLLDTRAGPLTDRQRDYVGSIAASGAHLLDLINDVLDLSKIEAGRFDLHDEEVDVATAIGEVHALQEHALVSAGLRFDASLPRPLPQLMADRRALRQMLLNLVSNAVKYTPKGGRITVEVARTADGLAVTVTDTGVGIAPEDRDLVLEPFRQVFFLEPTRLTAIGKLQTGTPF